MQIRIGRSPTRSPRGGSRYACDLYVTKVVRGGKGDRAGLSVRFSADVLARLKWGEDTRVVLDFTDGPPATWTATAVPAGERSGLLLSMQGGKGSTSSYGRCGTVRATLSDEVIASILGEGEHVFHRANLVGFKGNQATFVVE